MYQKRPHNDVGMSLWTFAYYKMLGLNYMMSELELHTKHLAEFFRLLNVTQVKIHLHRSENSGALSCLQMMPTPASSVVLFWNKCSVLIHILFCQLCIPKRLDLCTKNKFSAQDILIAQMLANSQEPNENNPYWETLYIGQCVCHYYCVFIFFCSVFSRKLFDDQPSKHLSVQSQQQRQQ